MLLSSQASEECFNPSPQLAWHKVLVVSGEVPPLHSEQVSLELIVPPVQIYIFSMAQVELHPSLFAVF